MNHIYPNSWQVRREGVKGWETLSDSVGNKSYAMGYLNALCSFYPHPEYQLVNNDAVLFETRPAWGPVQTNGGEG